MNFSTLLKNWPSEGVSIPEGWNDGSLARSAWEGRTQESVPLGYGVSSLPLSNELARALLKRCRHAATFSYRTLRDGFVAPRFPGTSCQATIKWCLRDGKSRFLTARVEERAYE